MVNKNIKVYIVTNENMDILGVYSNIKAAKACVADDPKFRKYTVRILQTEYDPTFENEFLKENNNQENVEKPLDNLFSDLKNIIKEKENKKTDNSSRSIW